MQVKQDNSLSSLLDALYNNEGLSTPKNDFLDNIKVDENQIPPTPALVDETFNPFEEAFLTTNAESTLTNSLTTVHQRHHTDYYLAREQLVYRHSTQELFVRRIILTKSSIQQKNTTLG